MHYPEAELKKLKKIITFYNEVLKGNELQPHQEDFIVLKLLYDKLNERPWDKRCPNCSSTCTHKPNEGYWVCPDTFDECDVRKIYCDRFKKIVKIERYTKPISLNTNS